MKIKEVYSIKNIESLLVIITFFAGAWWFMMQAPFQKQLEITEMKAEAYCFDSKSLLIRTTYSIKNIGLRPLTLGQAHISVNTIYPMDMNVITSTTSNNKTYKFSSIVNRTISLDSITLHPNETHKEAIDFRISKIHKIVEIQGYISLSEFIDISETKVYEVWRDISIFNIGEMKCQQL